MWWGMDYQVACEQLRSTIAGIYRFGHGAESINFVEKSTTTGLEMRISIVLRGGRRMMRGLGRLYGAANMHGAPTDVATYTRFLLLHALFVEAMRSSEQRRCDMVAALVERPMTREVSEALEESEMEEGS